MIKLNWWADDWEEQEVLDKIQWDMNFKKLRREGKL